MESTNNLSHLFAETQDLLAKLSTHRVPELAGLREKLENSMADAKDALKLQRASDQVNMRDVAASFNDYVTNYPWIALATGVLIASTIGILATKATKRSLHH